jgi:hypothetical protein
MTQTQAQMLRFAHLHDWGYDAKANEDGSVTVGYDVCQHGMYWERRHETVRTMQELRDVAGY